VVVVACAPYPPDTHGLRPSPYCSVYVHRWTPPGNTMLVRQLRAGDAFLDRGAGVDISVRPARSLGFQSRSPLWASRHTPYPPAALKRSAGLVARSYRA
jgi:hypothetical protein